MNIDAKLSSRFPEIRRAGSVAVFMSTYNGENHINEQLNSILCQLTSHDRLIVRDDGSSDSTVDIIKSYSDPRIVLIQGENLGFVGSFLWLLFHVESEHAVYLLADQDDIWDPDKIDRAYQAVGSVQSAALYCTRLRLVDASNDFIGLSPNFRKQPSFWNAACENIATGCTIAINQSALDVVRSVPWDSFSFDQIGYHDWWLYLTISRFGAVYFDPVPSMNYRQHGANFVGMGAGLGRYLTIWRSIQKISWTSILIRQLRFFTEIYGHLVSPSERILLQKLSAGSSWRIAMNLILSSNLCRQSPGGSLMFRGLVIYDLMRGRIPSN
ncbi:MAG: glycosyltransferase family 2 protein [Hyphomicrobiales bacterium]|nr:MAG: glycosyltransferase family 2 protein [Hyphomicrobiales bacterium]